MLPTMILCDRSPATTEGWNSGSVIQPPNPSPRPAGSFPVVAGSIPAPPIEFVERGEPDVQWRFSLHKVSGVGLNRGGRRLVGPPLTNHRELARRVWLFRFFFAK